MYYKTDSTIYYIFQNLQLLLDDVMVESILPSMGTTENMRHY